MGKSLSCSPSLSSMKSCVCAPRQLPELREHALLDKALLLKSHCGRAPAACGQVWGPGDASSSVGCQGRAR